MFERTLLSKLPSNISLAALFRKIERKALVGDSFYLHHQSVVLLAPGFSDLRVYESFLEQALLTAEQMIAKAP